MRNLILRFITGIQNAFFKQLFSVSVMMKQIFFIKIMKKHLTVSAVQRSQRTVKIRLMNAIHKARQHRPKQRRDKANHHYAVIPHNNALKSKIPNTFRTNMHPHAPLPEIEKSASALNRTVMN
jgi:hypothetical protein